MLDGGPVGDLAEAGNEGGFLDAGGVAAEMEEAAGVQAADGEFEELHEVLLDGPGFFGFAVAPGRWIHH